MDVGTPSVEGRAPDAALDDWALIRRELARYDAGLAARSEIVALNKIDLLPDADREQRLAALEAALRERGCQVARISGATGEGIDALLRHVAHRLDAESDEGVADT